MFGVQVFDTAPDQQRWRDVEVILDEDWGYNYLFSDARPGLSLPDALELVRALVASYNKHKLEQPVRAGIVDLISAQLIYDTSLPGNLTKHPEFKTADEPEWVERFVEASLLAKPNGSREVFEAQGRALYTRLRHDWPENVAWDSGARRPGADINGPRFELDKLRKS